MTNEQSLKKFNEFIAKKEEHYIGFKYLTTERKRRLKKSIYKKMNPIHANQVWEWLNDED